MKNTLRQAAVGLTTLVMLTVNILANALPFNGKNTGQISDLFQVYFVPAGYVFSIWGVIYIGVIAYTIYQALPANRDHPRMQATGWWVVLGNLANTAWIFLWHYEQFVATLGAMFILLATLIIVYLRLRTGSPRVSAGETWAVRVPFSIYLGWITVATIANVSDVLDYVKWNQFGLSDAFWMVTVLAVVIIIGGLMIFRQRDIAYAAVLLWALVGIGVKFPAEGVVTAATWVTFAVIAASLGMAFLLWQMRTSKQ
jgi:hypothetical protein